MCTTCVAQGSVYVGGALGALRIMAARSRARRLARVAEPRSDAAPGPDASDPDVPGVQAPDPAASGAGRSGAGGRTPPPVVPSA